MPMVGALSMPSTGHEANTEWDEHFLRRHFHKFNSHNSDARLARGNEAVDAAFYFRRDG